MAQPPQPAPDNLGVFSTGLTAKAPIDALISLQLGNWYVKGELQYYHIFNDALLAAGNSPVLPAVSPRRQASAVTAPATTRVLTAMSWSALSGQDSPS